MEEREDGHLLLLTVTPGLGRLGGYLARKS